MWREWPIKSVGRRVEALLCAQKRRHCGFPMSIPYPQNDNLNGKPWKTEGLNHPLRCIALQPAVVQADFAGCSS